MATKLVFANHELNVSQSVNEKTGSIRDKPIQMKKVVAVPENVNRRG